MNDSGLGLRELHEILDFQGEGIIYQRADGKILLFNKAAQQIFGLSEEEASGRTSTSHDWHLVYLDGSPCPGEEHPSMTTLRTGRALSGEIRGIASPDRPTTWLSINTRPILCPGEASPAAVVISFRDITQQKWAEDELKESQARYRAIFDTNQAPKLLIDPADGAIVDANQAACRFYGYTIQEMRAKTINHINALPPEMVKEEMERAKLKECLVFHFPHRLKSGEVRDVEVYSGPVQDKGRVLLHSIIFDVTEREQAEKDLVGLNQRLQLLLDVASDGIHIHDSDGNLVEWSDSFRGMLGYDKEEMASLNVSDWDAHFSKEELAKAFRQQSERPMFIETVHRRRDGSCFPVEINSRPIELDGEQYIYASARDITERKRAEQTLRSSEAHLEEAQRIAHLGSWDWVAATDKVTWSKELYRILEMDPDIPAPSLAEQEGLYTPDSMERMRVAISRTMRTGGPYEVELQCVRSDGSHRWLLSRGERWYGEQGELIGLRGTALDITERKLAEEELRKSEQDLRESQKIAKLGIWRLDAQTNEVYWTEELYQMYGFDPNLPPPPYNEHMKLFTPKSWELLSSSLAKTVETGAPYQLELEMVKPDGGKGWMWVRGEAITDESGKIMGLWGAAQDITERVRMERSLLTLSECSKALMRAEDEGQLMEEVCRVLTQTGGYKMAWVGIAQHDPEKSVRPVTWSGYEDDYLETVRLSWKDDEYGRGPTGTAIRENRTVIAEDTQAMADYEPWRREAEARGYRSSIALPISSGDQVIGALNIYAQSPKAFGPDEVGILQDLAGELGYGLRALRARKDHQKAEAELSSIFSMSLDLICIADINTGTFLKVNPAFTEILGYSEEELLAQPFSTFIHTDDIEETSHVLEKSLRRGIKVIGFENRYRCKYGGYRWLSWVSQPNTAEGITFAVARDITEWKQNQLELQQSKALLDATGRMARVGGWELDAETMEVTWTEETHRIHEVPLEYKPPLEEAINFWHPDDRDRLIQAIKLALEKGEPYDMELRFITAKGRHLWARTVCRPEVIESKTVRLVGTFQDITERKQAEQALRETDAMLANIASQVPGMLYQFKLAPDGSLSVPYSSQGIENIFGCTPEDVRNNFSPIFDAIHPEDRVKFLETIDESARQMSQWRCEYRVQAPAKPIKWVMGNSIPEKKADGSILWSGYNFDITERKLAELALGESEEQYRRLTENSPDIIYRMSLPSGAYEFVSPAVTTVFGYPPEAWYENPLLIKNIIHPDWQSYFGQQWDKLQRGEVPPTYEYQVIHANGEVKWINQRNVAVRDEDGRLLAIEGIVTDITEQRTSQRLIEASEAKYRALFDQSFQGIYLHDFEGRIRDVNQMACIQSGYSRDELLNLSVFDLHPQGSESKNQSREHILEQWRAWGSEQRIAVEAEHRHKDGAVFPVRILSGVVRYGNENLILALVQDISDRKEAERALQEATAMLRTAMDCSPAGIAIAEAPSGKLLYVNRSALGIRGGTPEELVENVGVEQYVESWQILHFDGTPYKEDEVPLARAVKYGETCDRQFILRRPDNEDRVVWGHAAPVLDDKDQVIAGIVVFPDITELKRTEQALREREADLKKAQQVASVGSWRYDPTKQVSHWTEEMFRIVGRQPSNEPLTFDDHRNIIHPDDWGRFKSNVSNALENGIGYDLELRVRRPNGEIAYVRVICEPELDDCGKVVQLMGTTQDITESKRIEAQRKELEAKVQQAQKMDALGTLTSGIAHDFNNLLAAIMGYAELATDEMPKDALIQQDLDAIIAAATKARNLVRQILTFSREVEGKKQPLSLNKVAEEANAILDRTIPKMINLEFELQQDLWPVNADAHQMEQVFINLVTNAADAGEGNGRIWVSTSNVSLNRHTCAICGVRLAGRHVLISVKDDGTGMSPKVQARIFEPFFTTKGLGKGTGLGLSTVYGIVTGHGGHICCKSREGEGTEFMIYLPAVDKQIDESETGNGGDLVDPGSGTIMVVDDEPTVRDIAHKMLSRGGYHVLQAKSGEEALVSYKERKGEIDLVLLDLGMPGMGGKACLKQLRVLDPNAKVLIASGYIQYELTDELESLGAAGMVTKPYRKSDILKAVKEALGS